MTKAALRKIYKEKRKQISWKEKERWTDLILINFQKLDLPFIDCVHTYLSIEDQNEVDTDNIIRYLNFKNPGLKVAVPKINLDEREMKHYIFNDDTEMAPNSFGIIEPLKGEKVNAEEIDMAFQPFFRSQRVSTIAGNGIGLPLTKKLITLHNGKISISSIPEKGTEVLITLPLI